MNLHYDGSPSSVERIMDVIGTRGVLNCEGDKLLIDRGTPLWVKRGEFVAVDADGGVTVSKDDKKEEK